MPRSSRSTMKVGGSDAAMPWQGGRRPMIVVENENQDEGRSFDEECKQKDKAFVSVNDDEAKPVNENHVVSNMEDVCIALAIEASLREKDSLEVIGPDDKIGEVDAVSWSYVEDDAVDEWSCLQSEPEDLSFLEFKGDEFKGSGIAGSAPDRWSVVSSIVVHDDDDMSFISTPCYSSVATAPAAETKLSFKDVLVQSMQPGGHSHTVMRTKQAAATPPGKASICSIIEENKESVCFSDHKDTFSDPLFDWECAKTGHGGKRSGRFKGNPRQKGRGRKSVRK